MNDEQLQMLILETNFLKNKLDITEDLQIKTMIEFEKGLIAFTETLPNEEKELVLKIQKAWDDKAMEDMTKQMIKEAVESEESVGIQQKKIKKKTKFFKDVFKSIAKLVHPDKLVNLSEKEKEEKTKILEKAQLAMDEENVFELLQIANSLKIKTPPLSTKEITAIKKNNNNIEKKIKTIQKTVSWSWYHAKGFEKNKIMINYVQYIAENFKKLNK